MNGVKTIPQLLRYAAANRPNATYLLAPEDGVRLSFRELHQRVANLAHWLQEEHGVRRGQNVGIMAPNGADFVIGYLSLMYAGAVACPINKDLTDSELRYVVERAEMKLVLATRELEGRVEALPGQTRVRSACVDDSVPLTVERSLTECEGADLVEEDDVAHMLFTSGTTGVPKGVMITHRSLLLDCLYISEWHGMNANDRALCILPLFHANAQVLSVLCPLYSGGSVVVCREFHASRLFEIVRIHGVTWCSAVPTIFWILLEAAAKKQSDSSGQERADGSDDSLGRKLRYFISGGGPLAPDLLRRFEDYFGVPIIEGYGLTEATCRVAFNPNPGHVRTGVSPPGVRKAGSVGMPIGDVRISIVDAAGRSLAPHERGEIMLQSGVIMKGYYGDKEATAGAIEGGRLHTGDIGYLDGDGYLHVVGRLSELIIRGGQNVYPREVEAVLSRHPGVQEVAVVAIPSDKYGEAVGAFIVPTPSRSEGVSAETITSYCRAHLAPYKCPERIEFLTEVPRTATGKVSRARLKEMMYREIYD